MSIRTTCPYCGVGCGVLASADSTIKGDPDHPANFGRLCSKGAALGQTIDLEGRALAPKVFGHTASWQDATSLVASRFSEAIKTYGPNSVAFYVSGQLLTEDYYVANKLMKGFIGSANIDTNSRLCMASSVAGHKRAFGADVVPGTYEDLEQADLIVLTGSNLAWCHPVLFQRILAAKEKRPWMKIVVVDPRRTASCEMADLHLPIKSDGDIALFNSLLAHLVRGDFCDKDFIASHVNGFDAAKATAAHADSGLDASLEQQFFDLWSRTEKVVTIYSQGVNQSSCGTDKVNAILNCHLATGRIGRTGMGPFSVTGQPNAMGGREVGGLANMLASHLDLENANHRGALQGFWHSPAMAEQAGLKAVDLFDACASGQIKALWVMSTNPAASMPRANAVAQAIKNVPFVVVSDIMEHTDTTAHADVILPAAGWGEKSGTVTNSERRISRQRAFLPKPKGLKPDWQIICDVAKRMGFETAFDFKTPAEVFDEYARTTTLSQKFGRALDLTGLVGLSADAYDDLSPVQWPVPSKGAAVERFFGAGGFIHSDGKAKMMPIAAPVTTRADGFKLNTGRVRDQWHTMTRTGKSPRLGQHLAEPFVEIHPNDAEKLGLCPAELIEVSKDDQRFVARALIRETVQEGNLFAPMHWTRIQAPNSLSNTSVQDTTDPVSGQPALKSTDVSARKFDVSFFGFLASLKEPFTDEAYFAKARVPGGWQAELASVEPAFDPLRFFERQFPTAQFETIHFVDHARGWTRMAAMQAGRLQGAFFVAPNPVAVARASVVSLLGQACTGLEALAGIDASDAPDEGPIVCSCLEVGKYRIQNAIEQGARSLDEIATLTYAGSNCGSCRPEIASLIASVASKVAAE